MFIQEFSLWAPVKHHCTTLCIFARLLSVCAECAGFIHVQATEECDCVIWWNESSSPVTAVIFTPQEVNEVFCTQFHALSHSCPICIDPPAHPLDWAGLKYIANIFIFTSLNFYFTHKIKSLLINKTAQLLKCHLPQI